MTDLGALIEPLQPFAKALINLGGRAGVQPRVTSTLRTRTQQQRLYDGFLRGESKYPVAPPGTSAHEFGYAFDMVADNTEDLHDLGTVWKGWGGIWSPTDEVHFEFPGFRASDFPEQAKTLQELDQTPWWLWSPQKAAYVCDLLTGKWYAALLQLEWPESEILKLLNSPCTTVLAKIVELGI